MKRIVILTWALVLLLAAPIHAAGPFSDVRQTDCRGTELWSGETALC